MIEITETLVELPLMAQRLHIPLGTVQGWIEAGLEHEQWHGRVLTTREALKRFRQVADEAMAQRQVVGEALAQFSQALSLPSERAPPVLDCR